MSLSYYFEVTFLTLSLVIDVCFQLLIQEPKDMSSSFTCISSDI